MSRLMRAAGVTAAAVGLALVVYTVVTVVWGDPLTSLYTQRQQHKLDRELAALDARWARSDERVLVSSVGGQALVSPELRRAAIAYRRRLRGGHAFGRIIVPRLHLNMVVVEGTSRAWLERGPGHYTITSVPGVGAGHTIAVAGHRTTYLHPFRHIDDLRSGDRIYVHMPYGRFAYVVYHHRVVGSHDWSILRRRPYEKLVLTACHPLYSASHRWAVFARLVDARAA